jgi:hypothetical protein
MPRSKQIPKVPIHGKAAHNGAFLVAIGNLIINWANNESVFLAMLQLLVGGGRLTGAIIWNSQRTSNARVELVGKLCRERIEDCELLKDITDAINHFKTLSRTRNFYCHSTYNYSSELILSTVHGVTAPQEGAPISFKTKKMDLATLNEIGHVSVELSQLNRALWALVIRLQNSLGLRLELPAALQTTESPNPSSRTRRGKGAKPQKPQTPSGS